MPSATLRLRDYRRVVALGHECRELGDDVTLWHAHWFRELARLTGADLVIGGEVAVTPDGALVPLGTVEWGWKNGLDRSPFLKALTGQADMCVSPIVAASFARRGATDREGLTRTDLLADRAWYTTPYFESIHKPIGIDHCALSFLASPGRAGVCSSITLSRGVGVRNDYTARDRKIIGESHALIASLIGGPLARFSDPSPSALPPRVRQVLRCVLEGDGDKQIAARLGISTHTVNQYTKTIHRHFGVATRAELLARWVRRGWGAKFAWAANLDG
jgi:DNA-binding CsgD family transcriptional regulator